MTEDLAGSALPDAEHHEGGFRPMSELIDAAKNADITRGGPHYGAFIEEVRKLMDRVRLSCPSDELAVETIGVLKELNDRLDAAVVDEWSAPTWTRADLPARGNITIPPYVIDKASKDGVEARITFRTFHLGGNAAAHGGQIVVGFDDLLGMAAALYAGGVTRTASLTVDYRSITPLNKELTLRTWAERRDGRKVYVRATLHDGERLCAEANGLFIVLKPGQP
ncbi:PaaI family thioesterase [Nocardia cyriacigeorgica]|uniref:PaaI family thioesterase n=1 Tax=Nocardia cyriacigeorgica TaxID=135487 RepID=UPI00189440BA|nr:PaaI family thioesterase [Nocardia cyriacigeorgica]MBF6079843.1 PaaI family thioesterase [Nocardia cyriacigeorgica]MBF6287124.1 PaaI family thioesterase [Nocardia cyriacigeorgica]MBF6399022.1 PaaI family thioesterase [Nocardia cyriacigeorgica]MBF6404653.1 PaaI family thioesterase [Nocardia cyriacigeorgica]